MRRLSELERHPAFLHAFSEKSEGNMSFRWGEKREVLLHRKAFLSKLGVKPENCIGTAIEHGIEVRRLASENRGRGMAGSEDAITGDAFLTDAANTFLLLLTGDCLPIVFCDPVHSAAGVAHASRYNTPRFLMREVIMSMERWYGSSPRDIFVGIGPGVRRGSYRFPRSYREELFPVWEGFLEDASPEEFTLDVAGWNAAQLKSLGVPKENIFLSEEDTVRDDSFFSHHRSILTGEPEGRMLTVAGIRE